MIQSTPSRTVPLPVWLTVGFYPFYVILWLGEGYYMWAESKHFKDVVKIFPWLLAVGMIAYGAFGLLSGKPKGRLFALLLGGVGLPAVGAVCLLVMAAPACKPGIRRHGLPGPSASISSSGEFGTGAVDTTSRAAVVHVVAGRSREVSVEAGPKKRVDPLASTASITFVG